MCVRLTADCTNKPRIDRSPLWITSCRSNKEERGGNENEPTETPRIDWQNRLFLASRGAIVQLVLFFVFFCSGKSLFLDSFILLFQFLILPLCLWLEVPSCSCWDLFEDFAKLFQNYKAKTNIKLMIFISLLYQTKAKLSLYTQNFPCSCSTVFIFRSFYS